MPVAGMRDGVLDIPPGSGSQWFTDRQSGVNSRLRQDGNTRDTNGIKVQVCISMTTLPRTRNQPDNPFPRPSPNNAKWRLFLEYRQQMLIFQILAATNKISTWWRRWILSTSRRSRRGREASYCPWRGHPHWQHTPWPVGLGWSPQSTAVAEWFRQASGLEQVQ